MNRQSKNAQRIAERLAGHPKIKRVIYPTLFKDPEQIRIRQSQCDYPGGIFSLDFDGGKRRGVRVPAQPADRAQRRVAGRRRNAGLPSEDDHAFRHDAAGTGRKPASATDWCGSRSASRTGATCWPISSRRSNGFNLKSNGTATPAGRDTCPHAARSAFSKVSPIRTRCGDSRTSHTRSLSIVAHMDFWQSWFLKRCRGVPNRSPHRPR